MGRHVKDYVISVIVHSVNDSFHLFKNTNHNNLIISQTIKIETLCKL